MTAVICQVALHGSLAAQAAQFERWLAGSPFALDGTAPALPTVRLVDVAQDGLAALSAAVAAAPAVVALVESHPQGEAALAAGAADYLLRAELSQPTLRRALRVAAERARLADTAAALARRLQVSEARFRSVIAHNADGVVVVDAEGIICFVNPAAETLFGQPAAALVGEPLGFPVLADQSTELEVRHVGQGIYIVEMRAVETTWEGAPAFLLSLRDITERKQAERDLKALARRNQQLAAAVAHLQVGVFITDPALTGNPVVFVNDAFAAVTGYAPEAVLGQDIRLLVGRDTDHEQARRLAEAFDQAIAFSGVLRLRRQDGEPFWGELIVNPVYDPLDRLTNFVGLLTDVTFRKQAEQALLEREKLQAALEKERELRQAKNLFMSTVSHEFRTPLAVILSAADMLDRYLTRMSDDQRGKRLAAIREQVHYLEDLLDEMQVVMDAELNRPSFHPTLIDVRSFCQRLLDQVQATIGGEHDLVFTADDESPREAALDPRLVRHILNNLLSNAIKYSPAGSTVRLDLTTAPGQVVFRVSDQGIGIPQADQARLFEPFYRGSNVGAIRGTGLGLKVVQDCVRLHGGTLDIVSAEGQGTVCTVRLPSRRWPT